MSYTCPANTSLGEILSVHFDNPQKVTTRQNPDGTWELVDWPAGLGSRPTQQQITTWASGQAAAKPDRIADSVLSEAKMLRAFAIALKIQFPALNLPTLLSDAKAAYKAL